MTAECAVTHPDHHCRAGDFKSYQVTFRSSKVRRKVAKEIVQRFEGQLGAFLSSSGDRGFSVSVLLLQQAMPHVQATPLVACCLLKHANVVCRASMPSEGR